MGVVVAAKHLQHAEWTSLLAASLCDRMAEFVDTLHAARERVLAIPLRAPFGIPAAIGIGIQAERLPVERQELLRLLDWVGRNISAKAPCASAVQDALD